MAPENGTRGRYEVQNALNYIGSEVHRSVGGLFDSSLTEEGRAYVKKGAEKRLACLNDNLLKDRRFLVGDSFTIADSYLYIVLSWHGYVGLDLAPYPVVKAYFEHIQSLPGVRSAHALIATSPSHTL